MLLCCSSELCIRERIYVFIGGLTQQEQSLQFVHEHCLQEHRGVILVKYEGLVYSLFC